jgi:DNA-binding NarL/FixJ family response regulator
MAKPLTSRETEVLVMLARGSLVREIADAFEITERSAREHIQMIVEKLGVNNRVEATTVALRDGLIRRGPMSQD